MRDFLKQTGLPTILSLIGGTIAHMAGLPAGMLMGGAAVVAVAAVAGLKVHMSNKLRDGFFVLVGMTLGSNVSSNTLALLPQWPWTLVGMFLALALTVVTTTALLILIFKFDRGTAYLSSFPGHLSFVLALAESGYGNGTFIAVIQSIRILLLTVLSPLITLLVTHGNVDLGGTIARESMAFTPLILLALACIAGGFIFSWLRISAAFVLGSMFVAMTGKLTGVYDGVVPLQLTLFGYVGMGVLIGSRFSGVSFKDLKRSAMGGVLTTTVAVFYVTGFVFLLVNLVDMPFGQIWLGLAPGGLESMGAIGVALGFDTAFIAGHHAVRMFILTFAISGVSLVATREKPEQIPTASTRKAK